MEEETVTTQAINLQEPVPVEELAPTIPDVPQAPSVAPSVPTPAINLAAENLRQIQEARPIARQGEQIQMETAQLFQELAGEQEELAAERRRRGIAELEQGLQDISNVVRQKQAEVMQDDVRLIAGLQGIEEQAIPMEFITGQQATVQQQANIARALKMSEIGVLNARVMAQQGNIALAEDQARRAVDAKYAPVKELIQIRQAQLDTLSPLFSAAEKKEAEALNRQYNLQLQEVEDAKETQKAIQSVSMEAIQGEAPQEALAAIQNAQTVEEALQVASPYIGRFERDMMRMKMANERLKLQMTQQEMAREAARIAAIEARAASGEALGLADLSTEQYEEMMKLRKAYSAEDQTKGFVQQKNSFNRIAKSAEDPSAAGDLALIFNYMKLLDPGSVVREGEFANAQNAAGVPERIRAKYNNVTKGERLTEKTRADFVDRAGRIFEGAQAEQQVINDEYSALASGRGLPSQFVVRSTDVAIDIPEGFTEEETEVLDGIFESTTDNKSLLDKFLGK